MIEVLSIKGNSVRIRSGIFVVDIPVIYDNGKYRIAIQKGAYYITNDDFKKLVATVLGAYEKSIVNEKSIEYVTQQENTR